MIVVDANVIVYSLIQGERTPLALQVAKRDRRWAVPGLWRHAFLNVLATFARQQVLTAPQARTVWRRALQCVGPGERAVDLAAALDLAVENEISGYDAQYLALARSLGVVCVSEDRRLQRRFPGLAVSMAAFCE